MRVDLKDARVQMQKVVRFLQQELTQVKIGRATPSLVQKIKVDAYETKLSLMELATITVPDPNELVIKPFDQSIIKNIEKAIFDHKELGLSPVVDEEVIRIVIPPLTTQKREELLKVLSRKLEAARVSIRQIRHKERSKIKELFEESEINEDEKIEAEKKLQEITDEMNEKVQEIGKVKEKEITSQ